MTTAPHLSVVIPVLNDAPALASVTSELLSWAENTGRSLEVIVVDGGSVDEPARVLPESVRLITLTRPGRGAQLACGANAARGNWIWLLHADSHDLEAPLAYLFDLTTPGWGRFDVRLADVAPAVASKLRVVASFMNWRSRLTGIATGDQGIFLHRDLLSEIGGLPEQPLMEDIELSRRLKQIGRPFTPQTVLGASGRRWQKSGVVRTVLRMWLFRLRYFFGASPEDLVRDYYG